MTDLVVRLSRLISIAENGRPGLRRSTIWKNNVADTLAEAQRVQLAVRWQDKDNEDALGGPLEELCQEEEETHSGSVTNETRIEHLRKQLHDTSESSTAKTETDNVIALKP